MKKKVCKRCKMFVDGAECPTCKTSAFSNSYQGRIYILDPAKSLIAEKVGLKAKAEYAIKVR